MAGHGTVSMYSPLTVLGGMASTSNEGSYVGCPSLRCGVEVVGVKALSTRSRLGFVVRAWIYVCGLALHVIMQESNLLTGTL